MTTNAAAARMVTVRAMVKTLVLMSCQRLCLGPGQCSDTSYSSNLFLIARMCAAISSLLSRLS